MKKIKYILYTFCFFVQLATFAQTKEERMNIIKSKIETLSKEVLGLNEEGNVSVSGVSLQEYLRGIAQSHNLNINIDPGLNIKIYNRFTNEKVSNIIIFLCEEYDLDIRFTGSIMSFYKHEEKVVEKIEDKAPLKISYDKSSDLLDVDLKNDQLREVVKKLNQVTGQNVVIAHGVGDIDLNMFLQKVPFESGLDKLAFSNGLKARKTPDGYFVLEKEDQENTKSNNSNNSRNSNSRNSNSTSSDELQITLEGEDKISIDAMDYPIGEILKLVSKAVNKDYFLFSEPKGNTTTHVVGVTYDEFLTYVLQGSDFTFKKEEDLYLIGERNHESLRRSKVVRLQHRSADKLIEIIPKDLSKDVVLKPFVDLNAIIISGSNPAINELEAFIKEIDYVVPMVLIEVILVDLKRGHTVKTGIRAGISDSSTVTGGTFLPGIDFTLSSSSINDILKYASGNLINLGRVTPNFYVSMSALEANENIDITSTPKLATLNGHKANLSIGRTVNYLVTQTNLSTGLNPIATTVPQWQNVQANLDITILPIVSGDEQVTLEITVKNSDFIGEIVGNQPPNTTNVSFESMIRVKNEEMIVLGGLEKRTKSESGSGTPFFSRIPIIKWLISTKSKSTSRSKSLVFIKPTIIY